MLHGRAVIDLHNTRTHRDERIVHDNMLTNWLRDYFSEWSATYDRKASGRTLDATFGGLMMFAQALSNDPDDYVFPLPHTNRMVAHGNNETYSGADYTRGSYNSAQSSSGDGTVTKVWDFTQEQGNGTIASLGLCSAAYAKCGSGSPYASENSAVGKNRNLAVVRMYESTPSSTGNQGCYVDWATSEAYFMSGISSGVLSMVVKSALVSVLNPIRDIYASATTTTEGMPLSYTSLPTKGTKTYDLSSELGNVNAVATFFDGNGYVWLTAGNSNFSSGVTRTFVRLKLSDGSKTSYTVQNNTGRALYTNVSSYAYGGEIGVHDGILYLRTTTSPYGVCYINLSDNTDCGDVEFGGERLTDSTMQNNSIFHAYCDGILLWVGNTSSSSSTTYTDTPYFIHKGTAFALAQSSILTSSYGGNGAKFMQYGRNKAYAIIHSNVSYASSVYLANTLCLTTKNNLDSAVTKTADMTMRVTYTVTDQAEE